MEIPRDGYCLLRAVQLVLKQDEEVDISIEEIRQRLKSELSLYSETYDSFHSCVSSSQSLVKYTPSGELVKYLDRGIYNSDIGDICIGVLCNALSVHLTILEDKSKSHITEIQHAPSHSTAKHTICLLRHGLVPNRNVAEHYDALVKG